MKCISLHPSEGGRKGEKKKKGGQPSLFLPGQGEGERPKTVNKMRREKEFETRDEQGGGGRRRDSFMPVYVSAAGEDQCSAS